MLLIGERILLICSKHNKKNNVLSWRGNKWFRRHILAASILHDLDILGNLVLKNEKSNLSIVWKHKWKYAKFELQREKPTGNPLLQAILDSLLDYKSNKLAQLIKFLGKKGWNLEENLWKELENKGILQNQKHTCILIKPEKREELLNDLYTLFAEKSEPDDPTRALLGLLRYSKEWKWAFRRSEWDKKWVKSITSKDIISPIVERLKEKHDTRYDFGL